MKSLHCFILFNLLYIACSAQVSLEKLNLDKGPYTVGFQHYTSYDSTRSYSRVLDWDRQSYFRPIEISVWYPAKKTTEPLSNMSILDYLKVYKQEMEWEHLPDNQILNWFFNGDKPQDLAHLKESTAAFLNLEKLKGKFPVLIYAPGLERSSVENFALFEALASQGYIILASPSRGADTRYFARERINNANTQAQDMAFLIKESHRFPQADTEKIACVGYSFGGLSTGLVKMRHAKIKAIISIDGSEKYQSDVLKASKRFHIDRIDVPYMHLAQKNIPDSVLKADQMDASLNTDFAFYDDLKNSEAYRLQFTDLTHANFNALDLFFKPRDPRQDKADKDILAGLRLMTQYCYHFLEAHLKDDDKSLKWLLEAPAQQKQKEKRVSLLRKNAKEKVIQFNDFHEVARAVNYQNLEEIYQKLKAEQADLELPEFKLNNLGLQLAFHPQRGAAGIRVFEFATQLYPKSGNLYDSLAEAHLYLGNNAKAIQNFERSLKLAPGNTNAIKRLKELKNQ